MGDGFFAVRRPDGSTEYTRNGSFDITIWLAAFWSILSMIWRAELHAWKARWASITMVYSWFLLTSDFTVESDGNIYDATGELVDRLLITIPPEGA